MTRERGGFDPDYFTQLARAEDHHFWFTSRNDLLARILAPIAAALPPHARVLEIGTGTGNTLRVLERAGGGARVVGVDAFVEGLRLARTRSNAALVCGSVDRLPLRGPFHLAAAFDVIEHVADEHGALCATRSVLAPGARLVVTVPAFQHLWSAFDEAAHHCRRYERPQLQAALERAGFRVDRLTFFMAALYPLVRARRWFGGSGERAIARELRVVPGLNAALRAILGVEARAVAAGAQPPFGTSLLAIATAR
jgi:SAM-dependent methyltransferase